MFIYELLNETFDNPYSMTWEQGDSAYDALVNLDDGTNLSINFNEEYDEEDRPYWHVEFWRNNSLDVTGEGDAQRIFATVLTAIQEFVSKERPKRIVFTADKGPGPSRANLYTRLVQRYAQAMGFAVETEMAGPNLYFTLTRQFGLR